MEGVRGAKKRVHGGWNGRRAAELIKGVCNNERESSPEDTWSTYGTWLGGGAPAWETREAGGPGVEEVAARVGRDTDWQDSKSKPKEQRERDGLERARLHRFVPYSGVVGSVQGG